MTNAELLQLNPQHLAELRSFLAGYSFDNVDIIARETVHTQFWQYEPCTGTYAYFYQKLHYSGIFRGKNHTHCIFYSDNDKEDNTCYCISHAKIGELEERIIFKLTSNN